MLALHGIPSAGRIHPLTKIRLMVQAYNGTSIMRSHVSPQMVFAFTVQGKVEYDLREM